MTKGVEGGGKILRSLAGDALDEDQHLQSSSCVFRPESLSASTGCAQGRIETDRLGAQVCEQRFCVFQVGGVQAFGELIVDFGEHRVGLVSTIGVAQQTCEADGCA